MSRRLRSFLTKLTLDTIAANSNSYLHLIPVPGLLNTKIWCWDYWQPNMTFSLTCTMSLCCPHLVNTDSSSTVMRFIPGEKEIDTILSEQFCNLFYQHVMGLEKSFKRVDFFSMVLDRKIFTGNEHDKSDRTFLLLSCEPVTLNIWLPLEWQKTTSAQLHFLLWYGKREKI